MPIFSPTAGTHNTHHVLEQQDKVQTVVTTSDCRQTVIHVRQTVVHVRHYDM